MSETTESKVDKISHVEDAHRDNYNIVSQREQRNAQAVEEKYHIPIKEVMESHLDEDLKKVKRIRRKVDLRLVPIISLLYMWAFIDRSNLGNVRDFWVSFIL